MKKVISVVGARPNFMKVAPIHKAFAAYSDLVQHLICHTGQHYDKAMSKVFFDELEMPQPAFYLGISSGSQIEQIANIMLAFENILKQEKPDLIIVVGDVNSTIACGLVASRLGIKIVHVEAGLRSFDREMPEEVNRLLTDALADHLFVSEPAGLLNLKHEGVSDAKISYVGNVMIDSLVAYLPKINASNILNEFKLTADKYVLVTMHRPSNVDDKESLLEIVDFLNDIAAMRTVVFPIHPRTRNHLKAFNLDESLHNNIIVCDPLGYTDFMCLAKNSELVVTDSGGIQEETTFLQKQCITVRNNTERPVTVTLGTNQLIGTNMQEVKTAVMEVFGGKIKSGSIPELWDGMTAKRICAILMEKFL